MHVFTESFHPLRRKLFFMVSLMVGINGSFSTSSAQELVPGIDIPLADSPVQEVTLRTADGVDLSFAMRSPKGPGPFPVVLILHGGIRKMPLEEMKHNLVHWPMQTRFLDKGFITVQCSRRPYSKSHDHPGPAGFYDAVRDTVLIVEKVKSLPKVDKDEVVLYGGSGGGILAIATASQTELACVIAAEPAILVPLAPQLGDYKEGRPQIVYRTVQENPEKWFTGDTKREMHDWMKRIRCPILVLQGKPEGMYKANFEILIPEIEKFDKDIASIMYPDVTHSFFWGMTRSGATPQLVEKIVADSIAFMQKKSGRSAVEKRRKTAPE